MTQVTIVDYGLGNLHSVEKALRHEGASVRISAIPHEVEAAERLVLPGVGAFSEGMAGLRRRELIEPLLAFVQTQRPFLGICLGMQLLLSESEEFGHHEGLGLIPGRVQKIAQQPGWKVPHVGWNRLLPAGGTTWRGSLLAPLMPGEMVYFVHSFAANPTDPNDRLADTPYGALLVSAAIRKNNLTGCQFHPEKSGQAGLSMLHQFVTS